LKKLEAIAFSGLPRNCEEDFSREIEASSAMSRQPADAFKFNSQPHVTESGFSGTDSRWHTLDFKFKLPWDKVNQIERL
jgi:hypothetical protein